MALQKQTNKFYTPPHIAQKMAELALPYATDKSVWCDPACGGLALVNCFPKGAQTEAWDLYPDFDFVQKQDFLKAKIPHNPHRIVVMNPPFRSGLALHFLRKASQIAPTVVALMPATYLGPTYKALYTEDLGAVPFEGIDKPLHVCLKVYRSADLRFGCPHNPYKIIDYRRKKGVADPIPPAECTRILGFGTQAGRVLKPDAAVHSREYWVFGKRIERDIRFGQDSTHSRVFNRSLSLHTLVSELLKRDGLAVEAIQPELF
jgi:hypothetical protein